MSKAKAKLVERHQVEGSYAYEAFEKFLDRHLAEGHDIRIVIDPNGNCYAFFCAACDPRMGEAMETRH